jgi:hypothetical protein
LKVVENACLRHYDGVSEWVALMDVDEFFQPMTQKRSTVAVGKFLFLSVLFFTLSLLSQQSIVKHVAAMTNASGLACVP